MIRLVKPNEQQYHREVKLYRLTTMYWDNKENQIILSDDLRTTQKQTSLTNISFLQTNLNLFYESFTLSYFYFWNKYSSNMFYTSPDFVEMQHNIRSSWSTSSDHLSWTKYPFPMDSSSITPHASPFTISPIHIRS